MAIFGDLGKALGLGSAEDIFGEGDLLPLLATAAGFAMIPVAPLNKPPAAGPKKLLATTGKAIFAISFKKPITKILIKHEQLYRKFVLCHYLHCSCIIPQ